MNRNIYKRGLVFLSLILIALLTFFGYKISMSKNIKDSSFDVDSLVFSSENTKELSVEDVATEIKDDSIIETIFIDITGAINNPGVYEIEVESRVSDIIEIAGGFTETANEEYISKHLNQAKILEDEEKIYIPSNDENIEEVKNLLDSNNASGIGKDGKIELNTASAEQLMTLKGIGESFAQRIIDYREETKFETIEEIMNVKGIGEKTFENIKDNIIIE